LQKLNESGISIQPALNQVELNFWNPQPELLEVRSSRRVQNN
jgi:hypothetical protein